MDVVFHLSSGQSMAGPEAIANVSNLLADETVDHDAVALVANGGGVQHLRADTDHSDRIRALIERGVDVYSCQNAMNAQGLTSADLIGGVETVPSGVGGSPISKRTVPLHQDSLNNRVYAAYPTKSKRKTTHPDGPQTDLSDDHGVTLCDILS